MNKLTQELMNFSHSDDRKVERIEEYEDSSYIYFNNGFSVIFEETPENFLSQIRPNDSVYRTRLNYLRRKMGIKSFKDFTVQNWLDLIDDFPRSNYCDYGTIFGCGGEDSSEESEVTIDNKKYYEFTIWGY